MISQQRFFTILFSGIVLLTLAAGGIYRVKGFQSAVVTRYGEIVDVNVGDPGAHFKWPLVDQVELFDARFRYLPVGPLRLRTKDDDSIDVSTYLYWRVSDPARFLEVFQREDLARQHLSEMLATLTREMVAETGLSDRISRTPAFQDCPARTEPDCDSKAARIVAGFETLLRGQGVEVARPRLVHLLPTDGVRQTIEQLMISERRMAAERYLAEGRSSAFAIVDDARNQGIRMEQTARETAAQIIATAESTVLSEATSAFSVDAQFAATFRRFDTMSASIGPNSVLTLPNGGETPATLLTQGLH